MCQSMTSTSHDPINGDTARQAPNRSDHPYRPGGRRPDSSPFAFQYFSLNTLHATERRLPGRISFIPVCSIDFLKQPFLVVTAQEALQSHGKQPASRYLHLAARVSACSHSDLSGETAVLICAIAQSFSITKSIMPGNTQINTVSGAKRGGPAGIPIMSAHQSGVRLQEGKTSGNGLKQAVSRPAAGWLAGGGGFRESNPS